MVQRRTLSQALHTPEFSEAAIAFVGGSVPQPAGIVEHSGNAQATTAPRLPSDSAGSGTVSISFRLPAELCARLLRISLDRKLRRQKPFSQQDIMAEALASWLKNQTDPL